MRTPVWACGSAQRNQEAERWLWASLLHSGCLAQFDAPTREDLSRWTEVFSNNQGTGRLNHVVTTAEAAMYAMGAMGSTLIPTDSQIQRLCGREHPRKTQENRPPGEGAWWGARRRPTSVDEDIISSEFEEAGDVLEHERERVRLPIIGVVGELDSSLDVYGFSY